MVTKRRFSKEFFFTKVIIFGIFFSSCELEKPSSYTLVQTDSLVMDVPNDISENWQFFKNDSTFFVFPLMPTKKIIIICNENGKKVDSIPLSNAFATGENIGRVYFNNADSIYLLTFYTNTLFLLNHEGKIIGKTSLPDSLSPFLSYRIIGFHFGENFYNNKFLFSLDIVDIPDPTLSQPENFKRFFSIKREAPYFAIFENPFWNRLSNYPSFELPGFEGRYVSSGNAGIDIGKGITIVNDTIFLFNNLTDSVYKIAGAPLKVIQVRRVTSKYSTIYHEQLKADEFNPEKINNLFASSGYIRRLVFDPFRDLFYLSVFHSQKKNKDDFSEKRPNWSLIILDRNFNQLGEHFFEKDTYHSTGLLVNKKGLLIQRIVSKKVSDKAIFDIHEITKP